MSVQDLGFSRSHGGVVGGAVVQSRLQVRWMLWILLLVRERVRARRGRRLTAAAAGGVGVQHLQEEVVHQHHILPLHAGEVVHAFVATQRSDTKPLNY